MDAAATDPKALWSISEKKVLMLDTAAATTVQTRTAESMAVHTDTEEYSNIPSFSVVAKIAIAAAKRMETGPTSYLQ